MCLLLFHDSSKAENLVERCRKAFFTRESWSVKCTSTITQTKSHCRLVRVVNLCYSLANDRLYKSQLSSLQLSIVSELCLLLCRSYTFSRSTESSRFASFYKLHTNYDGFQLLLFHRPLRISVFLIWPRNSDRLVSNLDIMFRVLDGAS
jgi:hypothetical protein